MICLEIEVQVVLQLTDVSGMMSCIHEGPLLGSLLA